MIANSLCKFHLHELDFVIFCCNCKLPERAWKIQIYTVNSAISLAVNSAPFQFFGCSHVNAMSIHQSVEYHGPEKSSTHTIAHRQIYLPDLSTYQVMLREIEKEPHLTVNNDSRMSKNLRSNTE